MEMVRKWVPMSLKESRAPATTVMGKNLRMSFLLENMVVFKCDNKES